MFYILKDSNLKLQKWILIHILVGSTEIFKKELYIQNETSENLKVITGEVVLKKLLLTLRKGAYSKKRVRISMM